MAKLPSVCLCMMVRNESRVIRRALDSVMPHIDAWCITDTGSDDGTPELITAHLAGIPGRLHHTTFVDFGTSRTETIAHARAYCLERGIDYLLLLDADEYVEVKDPEWKCALDGAPFRLRYDDALSYWILALVPSAPAWRYVGRTHEYLEAIDPCPPARQFEGVVLHDVGDGGSKSDKFQRDARLLDATLRESPDNARAWFYLGETYLNGRLDPWRALECYTARSRMGGFEEEAWFAEVRRGHCLEQIPPPTGGVEPALLSWFRAWERRPWRAEPLHAIVRLAANSGNPLLGAVIATIAIEQVSPREERDGDILFIDRIANGPGLLDWGSLCEYQVGNVERARALAAGALDDPLMESQAERIRKNIELFDDAHTLDVATVEAEFRRCTWLRERGLNLSCLRLADGLMSRDDASVLIPQTSEPWRLDFERSISGYYVNGHRERSCRFTHDLARRRSLPDRVRRAVLANRRFHVNPIGEATLSSVRIDIDPGAITPGYHATNPSIAEGADGLMAVVRTVNYTLTDDGRYRTPGFVASRNLIGRLSDDGVLHDVRELTLAANVSLPDTGAVRGFEDLRLLSSLDNPNRFQAVANHSHPDGDARRAMFLLDIAVDDHSATIVGAVHLHGVRDHHHQKNWMPVMVGDQLQLVYGCHPTVVIQPDPISGRSDIVRISRPPVWAGDLRGGTQLVAVDGPDDIRWIALVHGVLAESPKRQYFHAWVGFDAQLALKRVSDPFLLHSAQIEFAAGLVRRGDSLLISWGVNDHEAWMGTIPTRAALATLMA